MMNGNLATYSGAFMPHTDKSNLRLDLNLMNLNMTNGSLTPCTPNGKIKVYMNNIASNVTKVKNASNECKEWKRCKLDEYNCVSLDDVLETFNASISEEQAWAICFSFIKCIRKLTKKGFKFKDQPFKSTNTSNLNHFIIYLHKDGYVHEKTIFQQHRSVHETMNESFNELNAISNHYDDLDSSNHESNGEVNGEEEFNEQELLMRLGLALFDALDHKKDSNEELLISSELENLIAKITLEEADGNIAFTIDEIYDICCSRKANQNEDKTDEFYTSICRTLVIETIELSTFLQTIYEGTQIREKMLINSKQQDCTDSIDKLSNEEPLKLHLAQWAKLWMQVLEEFRNGKRKLRKVETPNKSNQLTHLDRNAHTLIMEYIRSRPALMPANNRKLGPLKPSPQSLIEKLHDQIRKQDVKLKPVNFDARNTLFAPTVGRVVENGGGDHLNDKPLCNSENNSPMIRRKLIKADFDSFLDDDFSGGVRKYSSLF